MEDSSGSKRIGLSLFNSPKLFTNFTSKGFHETETSMMSPTSILDSKTFNGFRKNRFWSEATNTNSAGKQEQKRCCWEKHESKVVVGLGLVDVLLDDEKNSEVNSKVENRTVLFGSQLKIQIPSFSSSSESSSSPLSRGDFGIKTRNSCLGSSSGSFSVSPVGKSSSGCGGGNSVVENENLNSGNGVFKGCVSASEMELSEDYTRVICHGPNPRTTHIFDNCVIESSCFDFGCSVSVKESGYCVPHPTSYYHQYENFLRFCFYCKKNLEQGKDIYMYRGEMAFCSHECRSQGMSILEAKDAYYET
ncbi:FCS-Like Zinc finger 8-like [Vicia villosa]|uniref:FCS-Like Zinc finger 8-like n=1 Tax=Vicia villosa TaxID=3911 RepID=UPI00273BB143|nr:FCS-Like Zinc finger 8-like [Vicia villosa]XP_058763450.1 FCS-Like Zinc finger 8-like [Vicia villosa]XP_058763451.1 FCS-Like Zinc finger 8-like [Vicia villosa]